MHSGQRNGCLSVFSMISDRRRKCLKCIECILVYQVIKDESNLKTAVKFMHSFCLNKALRFRTAIANLSGRFFTELLRTGKHLLNVILHVKKEKTKDQSKENAVALRISLSVHRSWLRDPFQQWRDLKCWLELCHVYNRNVKCCRTHEIWTETKSSACEQANVAAQTCAAEPRARNREAKFCSSSLGVSVTLWWQSHGYNWTLGHLSTTDKISRIPFPVWCYSHPRISLSFWKKIISEKVNN